MSEMNLVELLSFFSKDDLKEMARNAELRGCFSMGKYELAEFLSKNIYGNPGDIDAALQQLASSQAHLVKMVASKKGGKMGFEDALAEFQSSFSRSTYYKALDALQTKALLFNIVDEDDSDILVIPSQLAAASSRFDLRAEGYLDGSRKRRALSILRRARLCEGRQQGNVDRPDPRAWY
ncbi:MAG: hypothetical protein Q6370_020585 [Candidatus Sigynarchaeota archaeon]